MNLHRLGKTIGLFSCILFYSVAVADDRQVAWEKLFGLGSVEYMQMDTVKPDGNKQAYHIFVRLPNDADTTGKTKYPTLYMLDGGANFPLFASYYHYLRFMEDVPPMILVGISYGTQDWKKGNARSTDYTAPSTENSFWGGAPRFEKFIVEKLMPELQSSYPVDSQKQILFGQSIGGQFGLYTSMYGNAPFYAVIATNPALHRNLDFFKRPLVKRTDRPKTYIVSAEFDTERFRKPALKWQKYWLGKATDWNRTFVDLPGHNHLSANPNAFRNGLKWIFAESAVSK